MPISENTWKLLQNHLGYDDEEMKIFKADPRNEEAVVKGAAMQNKTIIAEVVESHGCDSGHKVGDKFYFDGRALTLLTRLCPSRVCIFALHAVALAMPAMSEFLFAGADPNKMMFRRFGCPDVGVKCGGWGHVVLEISVEDRKVNS